LTRPRAVLVITGSELARGDRKDGNGPFLAAELTRRGLEPARIVIVGDGEDELEAALRDALDADLVVTSGGLGPTHDDRTVELVARALGVELRVDDALRAEIEAISRAFAKRLGRSYDDFAPGVVKQATVPVGAQQLGLVGTAPGLVVPTETGAVVVLPGPPRELQRLWPAALETDAVQRVLARAEVPEHQRLRFFGASESRVARVLERADAGGADVTVCAHDFEIHVDVYGRADGVVTALREELGQYLFAEDETPVAALVLDACRARGWTLATAESSTGGMIAERITSVPGSSEVFLGAVVAYANAVKVRELGVPEELLRAHGAVSAEVAAALAQGVRERLSADVGIGVTGIAGPGGGTPEKPVGLVYVHAATPEAERGVEFVYGVDRELVRRRATATALHLTRRLLNR
jgi:nicotinamide-nucleotide amidase